MASSANAGNPVLPCFATGTFTSVETTPVAEEVTIGWDPELVIIWYDMEGTNVDYAICFNGATSASVVTGADGISTTPANPVTFDGDGTIEIANEHQTADGVNYWIAFRQ